MRWNGFAASALFAACAALGWFAALALGAPLVGARRVLVLYLVMITATYAAGLAPRDRSRLATGLVTGALGLGVALLAHGLVDLVLGLGVVLAVARGVWLYRTRPARAIATEVVLIGGGLVFARFLGGSGPLAIALAIWGFFLVQSVFFLVGGFRPRTAEGRHPDPFEDAYDRALSLLD